MSKLYSSRDWKKLGNVLSCVRINSLRIKKINAEMLIIGRVASPCSKMTILLTVSIYFYHLKADRAESTTWLPPVASFCSLCSNTAELSSHREASRIALQLSPFLLCWIYEVFIIPLFRFLSYTLYFCFSSYHYIFSPYKALSFFRTQGFLISDLPFPHSVFSSFHYPFHI